MLQGCEHILDAGCGTGTFLELCGGRAEGIDINPDNVEYCQKKGLPAVLGSVLEIPFDAESFDGVHCSHVMQVFAPDDAVRMMRELGRVTKKKGVVIISTLNWFPRFFLILKMCGLTRPMRYGATRLGCRGKLSNVP